MAKRTIEYNVEYTKRPTLETSALPSSRILQTCSQSAQIGVLHQLGYLSSYAGELFNNLILISKSSNKRLDKIVKKVHVLRKDFEAQAKEKRKSEANTTNMNASLHPSIDRKVEYSQQLFTPHTVCYNDR